MRQLLHIFRKDVRGLWVELAVFMGSLVLACFTMPATTGYSDYSIEGWSGDGLVLIFGCFLVARLIFAETISGSNQFWTTRPYRWTSLLGAKALFILIFAHIPVFIAQTVLLWRAGFPILGNLSSLLWMQVGIAVFVSLPAATLAAVTSGLSGFVLFGAGCVVSAALFTVLRTGFRPFFAREFGWVSFALLAVTLVVVGVPVLFAQYRLRRTSVVRAFMIAAYVIGLGLSFLGGSDLRWAIQARATTKPLDTTSFQFSIGTPTHMGAFKDRRIVPEWPPASFEGTSVAVTVPLSITGIPPGLELGAERVSLDLATADAQQVGDAVEGERPFWDARDGNVRVVSSAGKREFRVELLFDDGKVYERIRGKPTTVRGFVTFVVIGNERSVTVPKTSFPYYVTPAFRCDLESVNRQRAELKDLSCRMAFRSPLQSIDVDGEALVTTQSFSPFPVDRLFNPVLDWEPAHLLLQSNQAVEFRFKEPVSYIRQKFEIHDVQLIEGPGTQLDWK